MTGKLRELIAWELQENWAFPVLELILAITIIQVLPISTFERGDADLINSVSLPFWGAMVFVFAVSAAFVFGRSFGEGVEKRKFVVLLSYPVSRSRVFVAKFVANLLASFCVFGSVLFVEGVLLFMFEPSKYWWMYSGTWYVVASVAPVIWGLMFLSLLLVVFFTSSLMTFLALAVKRFGLSVLIFLVYVFGIEYWTATVSNRLPEAYLSLSRGPNAIVRYLGSWYVNTFTENSWGIGDLTFELFLTGFCYLLVGGVVLLLASFVIMRRIDLD